MTDFNYNIEDLNDTASIAKKSSENFYKGQVAPLKTSFSKDGDMQRSLTQRDLQEVLSGDALYRSPNFALQISTNNVQSSINNILANGSATDSQDLVITDPNSEDPNKKLEGIDAFNQIIASSSLGRTGLGHGILNYAQGLKDANFNDPNSPDSSHTDTAGLTFDPTKAGQAEFRLVTIKENLTNEEQEVFNQRIDELKKTNIIKDQVYNFTGVGFSNLDPNAKIKATDSRDIGMDGDLYISTTDNYSSYVGKTVLPCASLIECLIYLNTKLKIRGSFDFGRGWIRAGGGELTTGTSLNDHVCGRGIDISHIGKTEDAMIDLSTSNEEQYRKAMDMLLDVLNTMDASIHPDLLAVDDRLGKDYGLVKGSYEIDPNRGVTLNGILQKKYRSLRKIDFNPDKGHRNHIHLAFGPERAGNYLDWTESSFSETGNVDSTVEINRDLVKGDPNTNQEIFKSYYTDATKIQNTNALYRALIDYGEFSPEVSAIFMCIAERESNFGPNSFAIDSDDYSIGLFQTNYSDTTNARFIDRRVTLLTPTRSRIV